MKKKKDGFVYVYDLVMFRSSEAFFFRVAKFTQMAFWTLPVPDYIFLRPWKW